MPDSNFVFATKNPAKFSFFNALLSPLELNLASLLDYPNVEQAPENEPTPEGNAQQKAVHAYERLGVQSFAIDTAFFVEGLTESDQPGVFVRREGPEGKRLSDNEMLDYYAGLFASLGGETTGVWISAIALVNAEGKLHSDAFSSETLFLEKPSRIRIEGEPLNSLQFSRGLRKYVSEMSLSERILAMGARATGILDFMAEHSAHL
ncbi:MAG: non-canonical purine NTP pyrophosphatase [Chloroflexi bacterium]|nr:non-canonical purine NTP pyrophosphatase [Chloroflexota bacterium]